MKILHNYTEGYFRKLQSHPDLNIDEMIAEFYQCLNMLKQNFYKMFELNPEGKIKKFSKGMKQKLGIVTAFMHNPEVLILDEPTSGLDPLMQNRFVELLLSEKSRGKTILMSSHNFEEVEKTCDNDSFFLLLSV